MDSLIEDVSSFAKKGATKLASNVLSKLASSHSDNFDAEDASRFTVSSDNLSDMATSVRKTISVDEMDRGSSFIGKVSSLSKNALNKVTDYGSSQVVKKAVSANCVNAVTNLSSSLHSDPMGTMSKKLSTKSCMDIVFGEGEDPLYKLSDSKIIGSNILRKVKQNLSSDFPGMLTGLASSVSLGKIPNVEAMDKTVGVDTTVMDELTKSVGLIGEGSSFNSDNSLTDIVVGSFSEVYGTTCQCDSFPGDKQTEENKVDILSVGKKFSDAALGNKTKVSDTPIHKGVKVPMIVVDSNFDSQHEACNPDKMYLLPSCDEFVAVRKAAGGVPLSPDSCASGVDQPCIVDMRLISQASMNESGRCLTKDASTNTESNERDNTSMSARPSKNSGSTERYASDKSKNQLPSEMPSKAGRNEMSSEVPFKAGHNEMPSGSNGGANGVGSLKSVFNTLKSNPSLLVSLFTMLLVTSTSLGSVAVLSGLRSDLSSLQNDSTALNYETTNVSTQAFIELLQRSTYTNEQLQKLINQSTIPGQYSAIPAPSCAAIFHLNPSYPSGYYWVWSSLRSAVRVYCDMSMTCGNVTGGWTRVAELDTRDFTSLCPIGLKSSETIYHVVSPDTNCSLATIRTCNIISDDFPACSSVSYTTHKLSYSMVCGRIIAYQYGSTDAFHIKNGSISSVLPDAPVYVDGVSLTHGSPRQHIWTFAAAYDEAGSIDNHCPCIDEKFEQSPVSFVGNDYFCDTASPLKPKLTLFTDDPLWDGAGCGPQNTCCSFNNPPWFYKQLPQHTTNDIEMRVCRDQSRSDEDIAIQIVDIFVQ